MKKHSNPRLIIASLILLSFFVQYCGSSKKATKERVSYKTHIAPILEAHCSPCHFENPKPDKGLLNTYETAKESIQGILYRTQLAPTEKKYMPFKEKKPPLSIAEIGLLKEWMDQRMPK